MCIRDAIGPRGGDERAAWPGSSAQSARATPVRVVLHAIFLIRCLPDSSLIPESFHYNPLVNQNRVDLKTDEGTLDAYIFHPSADESPAPAIAMYMDAFGIRPALGDMAERLASHGYVVALPNLYHRTPFAPFDPKQVAVEGPERARFKGMVASINGPMVMRDTAALLAHLDTLPTVKQSSMGALGYCMGGGYALAAAGTFPDRIAVAASFHG